MGTVLRRVVGGRTPALLVARVVEQGTLGVASLLLARRLGVDDYAPIAVILIVNSFAVSLSDFGLGTAILSGPVRSVRPGLLRHARLTNVAILAVAAALSTVLTGDARGLVIGSAVVWALSAEAFVRKACLIRLGATLRTAVLEVIGSSLVAISVAFAWFSPGDALAWTVAGLAAKHLSESVFAFRWRRALGSEGDPRQVISVWFTQVLAYACANVDFVIVGAVVSSAAFSVYSLGFRASAVISSQVGYAVLRVMLVDFSEATTADDRQRVLDRRFRQLFSLGAASAIVSAAAALFLPFILGGQWRAIVGVVVVLAVGVPWRMTLSVVGSLALGAGESRRLVTWEVGRLAATVVLLAGAALVSFPAFVVASSVVAILATCVEQHLVARLTGLRTWRHLNLLSGLGVAVALASGVLVSTPH